ncbi:MAG: DUF368 domain-containing protein, partial [Tetragenococcus sp.]|nr:DUF368 domain-containing protein [Tetragenococcus sp.]
FKENVLFFIPVGLGGLTGIFILSFAVSFLLGAYASIILWFFVGCIVGSVPALWKEAGKKGRSMRELIILIVSFVAATIFLWQGSGLFTEVPHNIWTWMIAGFLIALGVIVPGLSPSNFLIYMGMYKAMADGFKSLDPSVIIPIGIGGIITVFSLSKLMDYIFSKAYPQLFHFIMGVVFASTIMIIPTDYDGFGVIDYSACVFMLVLGALLGAWMSHLEERYK